jgi:hypothetical protein
MASGVWAETKSPNREPVSNSINLLTGNCKYDFMDLVYNYGNEYNKYTTI